MHLKFRPASIPSIRELREQVIQVSGSSVSLTPPPPRWGGPLPWWERERSLCPFFHPLPDPLPSRERAEKWVAFPSREEEIMRVLRRTARRLLCCEKFLLPSPIWGEGPGVRAQKLHATSATAFPTPLPAAYSTR